jgi:hypothetical protein
VLTVVSHKEISIGSQSSIFEKRVHLIEAPTDMPKVRRLTERSSGWCLPSAARCLLSDEENGLITGGSMSSGASLFSHLLEEMAHIIQTNDESQLKRLRIEFALPTGR